jgi:carboxyl-terminal processing protease
MGRQSVTLTPMSEQPSSRPFGGHAWILVIVVVAILAYGLGARSGSAQRIVNGQTGATQNGGVTGIGSNPPKNVAENVDFQEFWELWQVLQTKYYQQPIDEQKMLYGAMQGLASSLGDPYTVFFEPEIAKEFSDSLEGKFEGIGAEIGIKEDQLQIVAPLPESPAEKAGLLSGDAILNR